MPEFDRAIPPGGEGKIRLTVRTRGYQGNIQKSARVYSNDPVNSAIRLSVKGYVKAPIIVSPRRVRLYGKEGRPITRTAEVRSELDKPLILTPGHFNLAEKLTYSIEEIEKGKRFKVHFTTTDSSPQSSRGFLKLNTNYPEKPEITLWIKVRIQKRADGQQKTGSTQQ